MHIVIHPKIKTILLTIMAVFLVTIFALAVRNRFFSLSFPVANIPSADQQAAVDGVRAFYTLDYEESTDAWSERVCAHTTAKGCEIIKGYFAPQIHAMASKHQIKTSCDVKVVRLVDSKGDSKIWLMQVTLNNPWEGLESTSQNVYVEVALEKGQWLMNRILFEQEIQRFHRITQGVPDE